MDTPKILLGAGIAIFVVTFINTVLPPEVPRWAAIAAILLPVVLIIVGFLIKLAYMAFAVKDIQHRSLNAAGFNFEDRGHAGGYHLTAVPSTQPQSSMWNRFLFWLDKGNSLSSLFVVYHLTHSSKSSVGSVSIVPKHLKKHIRLTAEPAEFPAITYHLMSYWSEFGDEGLAHFMYTHQLNPHHMYVWGLVPDTEREKTLTLPVEIILSLYKPVHHNSRI